ncbi:conserved exported hypothetical protein [Tenacibaculum litopenaei]|uniref:anti-sigma factor n=1 Tax=Tenacibaculum litopenaei TaxID=396016 RepID=UPI0038959D2E
MRNLLLGCLALTTAVFTACSDDDSTNVPSTSNLTVAINGLENLGANYKYEGWIIVNGSPVSTGVFTVDDAGKLSRTSFQVDKTQLDVASKFVLTIEPANDSDPAPSATKLLAGDFSNNSATVSSAATVADFSSAKGKYILATPTDGNNTNERSGVWFLDISGGSVAKGLDLPSLAAGWKYEGWVVMNGTPVSTGTFTDAAKADDNAATSVFKGSMGNGPAYPGEDYIQNAPSGLSFPTDLRGTTIVISVEPDPDNSAKPFTLKPLAHAVSNSANDHVTYSMGAGPVSAITGTVMR